MKLFPSIELFKLNQSEITATTTESSTNNSSTRQQKFLPGLLLNNNNNSINNSTTTQDKFFQTQTVVYDFNWTPIPNKPTFGPSPAPVNYQKDSLVQVRLPHTVRTVALQ